MTSKVISVDSDDFLVSNHAKIRINGLMVTGKRGAE